MINFGTGGMKPFDLNHNYVSPIESAITGLAPGEGTNAEDALAQALALPWSDTAIF